MRPARLVPCVVTLAVLAGCASKEDARPTTEEIAVPEPTAIEPEREGRATTAIAPKEFPPIPRAEPEAAWVPDGYRVEAVVRDLVYPTSVELDDRGTLYVAEAGYAYGDLVAPARVWRITPAGDMDVACEDLAGPVNDLLWHAGRLYISHRGKVSYLGADGRVVDIVTGLPSYGDHQNNQLTAGPDGKLYVGVGAATNSGVVGLDNVYPFLWLTQTPDVHDISPFPLALTGRSYTTPDALTVLARQGDLVTTFSAVRRILSSTDPLLVSTGAFQPFGQDDLEEVASRAKANSTVLRFGPDGEDLEVFAWGLRNPFGLLFGPDGQLYATDAGYDERGSRPIANAPDCVWKVRRGAWYGFPDFAAGEPVTARRFRPTRGSPPELLLEDPPPCERPFLTRPPHTTVCKLEVDRVAEQRGEQRLFMAEFGGGGPVTAAFGEQAGNQVCVVDLAARTCEPFFACRRQALGATGSEHTLTQGPRHPIDVKMTPDGQALYVVDFGAMAFYPAGAGPVAHPYPGSGVLWRVVREDAPAQSPPADLSPIPGRRTRTSR
jgi:glucose/arabinose dehydrogenase